jgi:hypothetical protein
MGKKDRKIIPDETFSSICWPSLRLKIEEAECAKEPRSAMEFYLEAFELNIAPIVGSILGAAALNHIYFFDNCKEANDKRKELTEFLRLRFKTPSFGDWIELIRKSKTLLSVIFKNKIDFYGRAALNYKEQLKEEMQDSEWLKIYEDLHNAFRNQLIKVPDQKIEAEVTEDLRRLVSQCRSRMQLEKGTKMHLLDILDMVVAIRNRRHGRMFPKDYAAVSEILARMLAKILTVYEDYFCGSLIWIDDVRQEHMEICSISGEIIAHNRRHIWCASSDGNEIGAVDEKGDHSYFYEGISEGLGGLYFRNKIFVFPLSFFVVRQSVNERSIYFYNKYDGERLLYVSPESRDEWQETSHWVDQLLAGKFPENPPTLEDIKKRLE